MLENLYMNRREAKLAMQKLVQAAPEGECAEECRTAEEMTHLSDMSQDLLKLANKPTFKVIHHLGGLIKSIRLSPSQLCLAIIDSA